MDIVALVRSYEKEMRKYENDDLVKSLNKEAFQQKFYEYIKRSEDKYNAMIAKGLNHELSIHKTK